jgi:FkbM family methyltransferase
MINKVLNKIRKDGLSSLPLAVLTKIKWHVYQPNVILENLPIKPITLGDEYGGKRVFDFIELYEANIISCGLGEDASFDVEFAAMYNSKVIIVDPTPRAISHYDLIINSLGSSPEVGYSNQGAQLIAAYDLSKVTKDQLLLEKFALWTSPSKLNFFAPKNPKHVSYSITNFQNGYSLDTAFEHIEVDAVTLQMLLEKYKIEQLHLLKLDIEGAEIEVLKAMMKDRIYPTQIAVEFDGFNVPSKKAKTDYASVDAMLRENGYLCYDFDGQADFLYALSDRVNEELEAKL